MVNWSQEQSSGYGGTGSFGKKFVEIMLTNFSPSGW